MGKKWDEPVPAFRFSPPPPSLRPALQLFSNVKIIMTQVYLKGDHILQGKGNIATGETSQAITPFHFFDYFKFSNFYRDTKFSQNNPFSLDILFLYRVMHTFQREA